MVPAQIVDAMPALLTRVTGPGSFDEIKLIAIRRADRARENEHWRRGMPADLDFLIASVKYFEVLPGAKARRIHDEQTGTRLVRAILNDSGLHAVAGTQSHADEPFWPH